MNTKHTPGPWKVCDGDARLVALPGIVKPIPCGNVANARLIAAAPETAAERDRLLSINAELLAALEAMVKEFGPSASSLDSDISSHQIVIAARAAIAKARG